MKKKTLEERLASDILTDNKALNHYAQCKSCIFRDKRMIEGEEYGYDKCVCRIYGRISAMRSNQQTPDFFPYIPVELNDKPDEIYENTAQCEYYEQEKQKK